MKEAKNFGWFVLKILAATIIINGILSLLGGGIIANLITNPVGTIKGFFAAKATTSNAAATT